MDLTADMYVARVNRAIDVVLADLAGDLRLERLASEAGFSAFHFHRVFKSVAGETVAEFVARVRLERAIRMMAHHDVSLTEVAVACGFSSSSSFTRAFRNRYGVPPSAFDRRTQSMPPHDRPIGRVKTGSRDADLFDVTVRRLPTRTVLYRRVTSPYEPGRLEAGTAELVELADASGIRDRRWLGYSWDDPDIVDHNRCRYDIAIEVPADTRAVPPFGVATFAEMLVAEIDINGPIEMEQRALDWLFGTWLPSSRHLPAEFPTFEAWHNGPYPTTDGTYQLSVQLPIEGQFV